MTSRGRGYDGWVRGACTQVTTTLTTYDDDDDDVDNDDADYDTAHDAE